MATENQGEPGVDAMSEDELARYYEARKGNVEQWEAKPARIRVRRGGPSTLFSLRLAPEELEELQEAAAQQGRTVSDIVRSGALKEARGGRSANREVLRELQSAKAAMERAIDAIA
jgi:uncharacterized protein (DUF1778 family)